MSSGRRSSTTRSRSAAETAWSGPMKEPKMEYAKCAGGWVGWLGDPGKEAGMKDRREEGEMQPPLSLGVMPDNRRRVWRKKSGTEYACVTLKRSGTVLDARHYKERRTETSTRSKLRDRRPRGPGTMLCVTLI